MSSLSAILMNDDYYHFTLRNCSIKDGLHLAKIEALICLKARAYLDIKKRKEAGENINSRDIKKHRLDIIRLAIILSQNTNVAIPAVIAGDLKQYIEDITTTPPDLKPILKDLGLGAGTMKLEEIIKLIRSTYNL